MSQDKIESRRAFMKKFGKLAGAAAVAFMVANSNNAEAKPSKDNPSTCDGMCGGYCSTDCWGSCVGSCKGTCSGSCDRSR